MRVNQVPVFSVYTYQSVHERNSPKGEETPAAIDDEQIVRRRSDQFNRILSGAGLFFVFSRWLRLRHQHTLHCGEPSARKVSLRLLGQQGEVRAV